jgi:glutamate formiminotransferase/formiminotetrahydrofolate cyclodeaminase
MQKALACFGVLEAMAVKGNPNSASDVGVGALAALAALKGAALNVRINAASLTNAETKEKMLHEAANMVKQGEEAEKRVLELVEKAL